MILYTLVGARKPPVYNYMSFEQGVPELDEPRNGRQNGGKRGSIYIYE